MYSTQDLISLIAHKLEGVTNFARREAELLLMAYFDVDQLWIITHQNYLLEYQKTLMQWVERRASHEPLEYITNRVSFYSQTFYIAKGALIPRPETELLIDLALEQIDNTRSITVCEVGVGSGVISAILSKNLPQAKIIAVDISTDALKIAKVNTANLKVDLRESDLLNSVPEEIDILISNPPYIANNAPLEPNLSYEPDCALYGGDSGDEVIFKLIDLLYSRDIKMFLCEMGYDQKSKVLAYLHSRAYESLEFYKDLSGFDRGFILKR